MKVAVAIITMVLGLTVSFAQTSTIEGMRLHGKGQVHYMKFIKVYEAALYTEQSATEEEILKGAVSKCLLLEYKVSLTQKDFINAANMVLERQFSAEDLEQVQSEINQLHADYLDVKDGDNYTLCYDKKQQSTTLLHNEKEIVRIQSRAFAKIYFSIWLGKKNPLNDRLRDNLLARN